MLNIPVEIRNLFKTDGVRKNIRIHFPNGERDDITNENIVKDSFSFLERLCSRDQLKFGLCEANSLEFECFDVENIKGCEIEASVELILDEPIKVKKYRENLLYDSITVTSKKSFTINFDSKVNGTLTWDTIVNPPILIRTGYMNHRIAGITNSLSIIDTSYIIFEVDTNPETTMTNIRFEFKEKEYEEVIEDTYSIPYGRFTIDSCNRQSEFNNRKVIAYSKEVEWNNITNPIERAKIDGTIKCVQNTAYNYTVDPFVLSNIYNKDSTDELLEWSNVNMTSYSFGNMFFTSDETINNPYGDSWVNKEYNKFIYDEDGHIRWDTIVNSVAYGDGTFVCVGYAEIVSSYSIDGGNTWKDMIGLRKSVEVEVDGVIYSEPVIYNKVRYGNDRFVCVGYYGESYYSTDGREWHKMNGLYTYLDEEEFPFGAGYYDLVYDNGKFVCIGTGGHSYQSIDGVNWTPLKGFPEYIEPFEPDRYVNGSAKLVYGKDMIIAICTDGTVYKLEDDTWVQQETDCGEYLAGIRCGVYDGEKFVYMTYGAVILSYDGFNEHTQMSANVANTRRVKSIISVNDRYFAVGTEGYCGYSTNAAAWGTYMKGLPKRYNFPSGGYFVMDYLDLAYGDGIIVTVGTAGARAIYDDNKNATANKYNCRVTLNAKCFGFTSNTDADRLYKALFDECDETNLLEVENNIKKYIPNIIDKNNTMSGRIINTYKELRDILIQAAFKSRTALTTTTYGDVFIPLNGYHYIYPYLNLNSKEFGSFYTSSDFNLKTLIVIPYSIDVVVSKSLPSTTSNSFSGWTVYQTNCVLRNEEEIMLNYATNLSTLKMTVNRRKVNNLYVVDTTKLYDMKGIVEGFAEFKGVFGRHNRYGSFEFFKINKNFGIYPAEDLYPMDNLYGRSTNVDLVTRSTYNRVSYDEEPSKYYNKVSVTFKNTSNVETYLEKEVDHVVLNNPGERYQEYSLDDNYLISHCTFTDVQINEILSNVADGIKFVSYTPADIELVGLPYIETGDVIRVVTRDGGFETIILSRDLSGDQLLSDNYQSRG